MPYQVKLPDIGEGVAEGEIVRWMVKAGDRVREDQPLVEVMTDKANVEIPSPRNGVIVALQAEEGQVVPVGTVIVEIEADGEGTAPPPAPAAHGGAATSPRPATPGTASSAPSPAAVAGARVQATPAVRQLAKQLGVALEGVTGTGPGGAITAQDVQRSAGGAGAATAGAASAAAAPATATAAATDDAPEERVPLRGLRRKIAEHMRHSMGVTAPFTFVAECDMTAVVEHRARVKADAEKAGVKLTYMAYVLNAVVEPLRAFPMLNASLDESRAEIVLKRYYHLGLATHTPEGLMVPVIHHADRRPLFELASEIERLATAARAGTIALEDLQGGTFTITSTGAKGGVLATPILHHPQVAILGVHEIKKRPAVVGDRIVPRDLCNLSLTLDHRVVDGAVGADFLYALVERLEHPEAWLGESPAP